jgi:hypothetical protein
MVAYNKNEIDCNTCDHNKSVIQYICILCNLPFSIDKEISIKQNIIKEVFNTSSSAAITVIYRQINGWSKAPRKDTVVDCMIIIHKSYLKPKIIYQHLLKIYVSLYRLCSKKCFCGYLFPTNIYLLLQKYASVLFWIFFLLFNKKNSRKKLSTDIFFWNIITVRVIRALEYGGRICWLKMITLRIKNNKWYF